MYEVIAGIIFEGLKIFGEERRSRFVDEHHDLLTLLRTAENEGAENYTDADVDFMEEKVEDFLKAYHKEIKEFNRESN